MKYGLISLRQLQEIVGIWCPWDFEPEFKKIIRSSEASQLKLIWKFTEGFLFEYLWANGHVCEHYSISASVSPRATKFETLASNQTAIVWQDFGLNRNNPYTPFIEGRGAFNFFSPKKKIFTNLNKWLYLPSFILRQYIFILI